MDPLLGQVLGGTYKLYDRVGGGGFAVVYLVAYQP
jgi:hypothetical protein